MPYPSSHIDITTGISRTHAALIDSQNTPSDVLASPIVPKAISSPFLEKLVR